MNSKDSKLFGRGLVIGGILLACAGPLFAEGWDSRKGLVWNIQNSMIVLYREPTGYRRYLGKYNGKPLYSAEHMEPRGIPLSLLTLVSLGCIGTGVFLVLKE